MALHQFANDFFSLLGGDWTTSDLSKILDDEICNRRAAMVILSISHGYQVLKPLTEISAKSARGQASAYSGRPFPTRRKIS